MIYLLILALLAFSCLGGGGRRSALAAPSEAAPVRTPLELTFPAIQSDPYIRSEDYIDSDKNHIQGSGSKTKSCSIPPLIDHKSLQPANQPLYPGFCATSTTCGDSFGGVSFVDSSICGAASSSFQCCIPPSKPIYCAAPHVNSKCLNSNENRKAECVGGTFVTGLCPGGANDDVQCCVLPQEDASPGDGNRNKDLKNYNHATAAAASTGGDGSGQPMDWGYDETAETESVPRYEDQGNEAEKFRFPAQDMGLVDNRVGGDWRVQG